jgi:hypothetical protein
MWTVTIAVPSSLAAAIGLKKGETVQWSLTDKDRLAVTRVHQKKKPTPVKEAGAKKNATGKKADPAKKPAPIKMTASMKGAAVRKAVRAKRAAAAKKK